MGKGGISNAGRLAKRLREIPAQSLVATRREIWSRQWKRGDIEVLLERRSKRNRIFYSAEGVCARSGKGAHSTYDSNDGNPLGWRAHGRNARGQTDHEELAHIVGWLKGGSSFISSNNEPYSIPWNGCTWPWIKSSVDPVWGLQRVYVIATHTLSVAKTPKIVLGTPRRPCHTK